MKPSPMRKPFARAIASRSGTAQWCSSNRSAAAESFGISSRTSQASSSEKTSTPSAAASAPACGAGLETLLALDAEAHERADLAAELDRLLLRQVAEMLDLHLALRVFVDSKRVNHADGVALTQPLQLGDDLAVELGMPEAQHDQLNGSNRHLFASPSIRSQGRLIFEQTGRPHIIQWG